MILPFVSVYQDADVAVVKTADKANGYSTNEAVVGIGIIDDAVSAHNYSAPSAEPTAKPTTKAQRRQTYQLGKGSQAINLIRTVASETAPVELTSYEDPRGSDLYARIFGQRHIPKNVKAPIPISRKVSDGPCDFQNVSKAVRATNPILDELLHAIQLINSNSAELVELDLKDCLVLSVNLCTALSSALIDNDKLKKLNLANCKISTKSAMELSAALRINTGLQVFNLEGNQIAPLGMRSIGDMLQHNSTLIELKLNQQQHKTGTEAEQQLAKSMAQNKCIQKLSLVIRDVASRNTIDRAMSRNKDLARKARMASKS